MRDEDKSRVYSHVGAVGFLAGSRALLGLAVLGGGLGGSLLASLGGLGSRCRGLAGLAGRGLASGGALGRHIDTVRREERRV